MLSPHIIEEILKREREKERKRSQPIPLELPVENPMPRNPEYYPEKPREPVEIDIVNPKDSALTYFSLAKNYH